jgi:hypothetical protein
MTWKTLTLNDLQNREAAPLLDALQTAALGAGQDDPVPDLISSTATRIRGALIATANWVDPTPETIPPELKDLACRIVLRLAKDRLNLALTPDERRDAETDDRLLRDLALGRARVTSRDRTSGSSSGPAGVQVARTPARQATRARLDGLN